MLEKLKEILGKVIPNVDMSKVTEETKLVDDLGFDSLALMMMSMEIEDAFNFKFIGMAAYYRANLSTDRPRRTNQSNRFHEFSPLFIIR